MHRLLFAAKGDANRASRGIIFVDEIDKKRRTDGTSRDVSGESVQQALLKLMDGVDVAIRKESGAVMVNTRGVLFICAGAFSGIDELSAAAREKREIGFRRDSEEGGVSEAAFADADALIEFGMIPELVGRFATIRRLESLTLPELERVLIEPEESVIRRTTDFFSKHGAELRVSAGAIRAMAERAATLGTGARALERVATDVLEPTIWRFLGSDQHVGRIVITQATVERGRRAQFLACSDEAGLHEAHELVVRAVEPVHLDRVDEFTNTRGWTHDQILERLDEVVATLDLDGAPNSAKEWWQRFADEQGHDPRTALRLAEELATRQGSISEFFNAYVYSNIRNIQGVLHYLDYKRLKDAEDRAGRTGLDGSTA